MTTLAEHGYRCARVSASGQRKGGRIAENCLDGDIIALATRDGHPHLLIEVGGLSKRLGTAFGKLRESILPGFAPLVVRFVDGKRWYYVDEDTRTSTLDLAIVAIRSS